VANKLIVTIFCAALIALSSLAHSESLDDNLDRLYSHVQAGYSLCKIQAVMAELRRPENRDLDNCIQTQLDKIANLLLVIIPLAKGKPKALQAVKEFYSTWENSITNVGTEIDDNTPKTMRERVRTLSKELGSTRIRDW
jgi:hypothetical protein